MKIILTSIDRKLLESWKRFCGDLNNVTIYHGSILDLECDAVVSPANSFGFMDGGIDALYTKHFGKDVQKKVQDLIKTKHHGELLVGSADIVATENQRIPFLIAAPTMRVPMILKDSVNPYLAARAVFLLIKYGNFSVEPQLGKPIKEFVQSVAFPGLGTGVGQVGLNTCAHQVRQAIEEVFLNQKNFPRTWSEAQQEHQKLYTDRIRDLQYE